jgi:hypothetical protein
VPKFASGKTPKYEEGASAIHSAEVSVAPDTVADVEKVAPVFLSVMETVNTPPEYVTLAVITSPGLIVMEIWYIGFG